MRNHEVALAAVFCRGWDFSVTSAAPASVYSNRWRWRIASPYW